MPVLFPCPVCNTLSPERRCPKHKRRAFAGASSRGFPPKVRAAILARDGHRCTQCGSRVRLEADHITPAAHGGSDDMSNGRTLCRRCHLKRTGETHGWRGRHRGGQGGREEE